jgi:dipeptidyl-peptidase 9
MWKSMVDKSSKPIQVIYTERSSQWINVHDLLHFIEITDTGVKFLWASEESGYRHLYHVTSSLEVKPPQNGLRTHSAFCDDPMDDNLKARIVKKSPLTMGEWEVLGKNLWVDQQRNLVYFMGLAHSPLEKHLYVFNLGNPDKKRLLTTPGSTNTVEFNEVSTLEGACSKTIL